MRRIRGFVSVLLVALVIGALPLTGAGAQTPPGDVSIDIVGGGSFDLDARSMLLYETEYIDGTLERFIFRERIAGDSGLYLGMQRTSLTFLGLNVYSGLGMFVDPDTNQLSGGFVFGVPLPADAAGRIRVPSVVSKPGFTEGAAFELAFNPAPSAPVEPPVNPFFADSIAPIGHMNAAQTDSLFVPGPLGPTETLTEADLTYQHIGPAHFGVAISSPYPDKKRVIWSNGGDRISKLDYNTLETLAELPIKPTIMDEATADGRLASLDALTGNDLAFAAVPIAAQDLAGLAGVYYALDADNTLFVGGATSIIAYGDTNPGVRSSPIEVTNEWIKPAEIGGNFVGANITFDGKLALVTNEGWVVVAERDFSDYEAIQLIGAEAAPAHNAQMAAEGRRPGSADWVRNAAAIDEDGGIYVPSLDVMHKVIWDGTSLSVDPADGAWTAPFENDRGIGTGATPSLMGFGEGEDEFVVITDGNDLMNVVLYWRNGIPADWTQLPGTLDRRIAGQLPADFDDPAATNVQSEQSVVVGGYGAAVVNNEPASVPPGFPAAFTTLLAGHAANDPAFTPLGIQKFEWDPVTRSFDDAWTNNTVSSANSVPMVSTRSNLLYTVGGRDGDWTMEAVDWNNGSSAFHYVTGSVRYNTRYSGMFLDEEGRIIHTTMYGIVRYER